METSYRGRASSEGYLPSVLVHGPAVRRVEAVPVPVDPLHQPVVPGPSDRVQPRRKASLRQRQRTVKVRDTAGGREHTPQPPGLKVKQEVSTKCFTAGRKW